MPFTVLVAADLGGKRNYELTFPAAPTVPELRDRMEVVLGAEAALRRPPQAGPFAIHRVQVFDERMEMWVDLVASSQLEDYCQVYVFQKESPWHRDSPGRIPPPVKPAAMPGRMPAAGYSSVGLHHSPYAGRGPTPAPPYPATLPVGVSRAYVAPEPSPAAGFALQSEHSPHASAPAAGPRTASPIAVTHSEKVASAFASLDRQRRRRVAPDDWSHGFERARLSGDIGEAQNKFSAATVEDLFRKADRDQDGFVTPEEFQHFCEIYPKLLDCLYYRLLQADTDDGRTQHMQSQHRRLEMLENQLGSARDAAEQAERDGAGKRDAVGAAEADIEAAKVQEEAAQREKETAKAVVDDCKDRLSQARKVLQSTRDAGKSRDAEKRSLQRGIDTAEKKAKAAEADRDRAERALEALRRQVEQAEADLEAHNEKVGAAQAGVEAAREKAREAEDPEAERELAEKQQAVTDLESELRASGDEEQRLGREYKDAQRATQIALGQKGAAERDAARLQALAEQKRQAEAQAQRAADEQKRNIEALEQEDREREVQRGEEEEKENDLLQLEVRLREQREAVEKQEARLRSAHREFTHEIGRLPA